MIAAIQKFLIGNHIHIVLSLYIFFALLMLIGLGYSYIKKYFDKDFLRYEKKTWKQYVFENITLFNNTKKNLYIQIVLTVLSIIVAIPERVFYDDNMPITRQPYGRYFYYGRLVTDYGKTYNVPLVIYKEDDDYYELEEIDFGSNTEYIDAEIDPSMENIIDHYSDYLDRDMTYRITVSDQKAQIPGRKDDTRSKEWTNTEVVVELLLGIWMLVLIYALKYDPDKDAYQEAKILNSEIIEYSSFYKPLNTVEPVQIQHQNPNAISTSNAIVPAIVYKGEDDTSVSNSEPEFDTEKPTQEEHASEEEYKPKDKPKNVAANALRLAEALKELDRIKEIPYDDFSECYSFWEYPNDKFETLFSVAEKEGIVEHDRNIRLSDSLFIQRKILSARENYLTCPVTVNDIDEDFIEVVFHINRQTVTLNIEKNHIDFWVKDYEPGTEKSSVEIEYGKFRYRNKDNSIDLEENIVFIFQICHKSYERIEAEKEFDEKYGDLQEQITAAVISKSK